MELVISSLSLSLLHTLESWKKEQAFVRWESGTHTHTHTLVPPEVVPDHSDGDDDTLLMATIMG